ncbi:hypothetical protein ATI61_113272 [Archangium gephyra]|uniref:Uncharacterized protein n=1 Tax=Archangium gephyra TaxID=48 RepID=A0ABX9JRS8_9BACT|nr:hypothetical protein [Archangium gephyra]REG25208.1 hypothetical protein ATI61_113272 [Archangium gephyra]
MSRLGALTALLLSGTASASAFQLEARTEAQIYQIRAWRDASPGEPVLLPRRRIVQYLGLNGYELVTGQDVGFESSLRVFADFGLPRGEAAKIDGLRSEDADLLYAFVRYGGNGFEGRLGRQLYVDTADILAFDGLRVRYVSPLGLGAEVYGGLWVKGAGFLASSVYQPDGTRESDARRLEQGVAGADPSLTALEPVYGAKLLLEDLKGVSASLGYRRALVEGKTDLERATLEARYGRGLGLSALAGVDFDVLGSRLAQARAQVRWDGEQLAVSGEAMRLSPVFSADSIWYWFAFAPRDEARVRVDFFPRGPLRYYVQGVGSLYHTELNSTLALAEASKAPGGPPSQTVGGSAGAALRWGRFRSALDLAYRQGFGGSQLWADLTAGYGFGQGRFTLDGRLSAAHIDDGFNPLLAGNFFGAQVWASQALTRAARVSLVLEQNVNPFTRWDSKVFFLFDLKASL